MKRKNNHQMARFVIPSSLLLLSLLSCILAASSARAATSSFAVAIAPGYDLVDYPFQTNTVANAFPNARDGTEVLVLNPASKTFTVSVLDTGVWSPNLTLTPGEGFFLWNPGPGNFTYTVQGTPLTVSTYTMNFVSTNSYLVGSAFFTNVDGGSDWLSCQVLCDGLSHYTSQSYNYVPSVGDIVNLYCPALQNYQTNLTYRSIANQCDLGNATFGPLDMWDNLGPFDSPQLSWSGNCSGTAQTNGSPFRAILLRPFGGTTSWVQKAVGETCPGH
jgi:hypothetical protein